MAMDLNAKAAYIRGLMTGMEFDPESKNGKIIAAMMDLLEEMAATVVEHDDALDQDLDDVVSDLYELEDDEDDEDDEEPADLYEVTCPNCGAVVTVDEDTLLSQDLTCPNCHAAFDIEIKDEEDEEPSSEE